MKQAVDYFLEMGGLGLGSRLKRLSDQLVADVAQIYSMQGIEFEPKWFSLVWLLSRKKELTVTEAAISLRLTHPYVSLLTKELSKTGLIVLRKSPDDARSRLIALSPKGQKLVARLEPTWAGIRSAVDQTLAESGGRLLSALNEFELALTEKPLRLRKTKPQPSRTAVEVFPFEARYKKDFERLNREWLEKNFSVEEIDRKHFKDPKKEILDKGGAILFARVDGKVVGTCALLKEGEGLELAKMGVTQSAQGLGIGEALARAAINEAKSKGAKTLSLVTNSALIPAIRLYRKLGFKETFRGPHPLYKRVDLGMELKI